MRPRAGEHRGRARVGERVHRDRGVGGRRGRRSEGERLGGDVEEHPLVEERVDAPRHDAVDDDPVVLEPLGVAGHRKHQRRVDGVGRRDQPRPAVEQRPRRLVGAAVHVERLGLVDGRAVAVGDGVRGQAHGRGELDLQPVAVEVADAVGGARVHTGRCRLPVVAGRRQLVERVFGLAVGDVVCGRRLEDVRAVAVGLARNRPRRRGQRGGRRGRRDGGSAGGPRPRAASRPREGKHQAVGAVGRADVVDRARRDGRDRRDHEPRGDRERSRERRRGERHVHVRLLPDPDAGRGQVHR